VRQSWFGLALSPLEDKLWWSGGGGAALHVFSLKNGKLSRADNGDPTANAGSHKVNELKFRSGLALDLKRDVLCGDFSAPIQEVRPPRQPIGAPNLIRRVVGHSMSDSEDTGDVQDHLWQRR
jgi:hypothetical protein